MRIVDLSFSTMCALGVAAFFLAAFGLLLLVRAIGARAGSGYSALSLLLFAASLCWMQGFDSVCVRRVQGGPMPDFALWFQRLPVWMVLAAMAALAVCAAVLWLRLDRYVRSMLTPASLQEGLDQMPDGILYSTASGIPLLVNARMQRISTAAFGAGVLDTVALRRRLEAGDLAPGCAVRRQSGNVYLRLPDGSVWDLRQADIGANIWECVAYDVTEQYQKNRELEARNEHLAAVNAQIREYSRNMDTIIRDREMLSTKIRIHDDVGRSLLALRAYLSRQDGDRASLVRLWKNTVALLRREAGMPQTESRMDALMNAARAVHVQLIFDGALPADPMLERLTAVAIHACLTNTIKHAHGSALTIRTVQRDDAVTIELTNDGQPPDGPIQEQGGLRTLRSAVEQNGGTMEIEWTPRFVLRVGFR